jgi:hypothetical protein
VNYSAFRNYFKSALISTLTALVDFMNCSGPGGGLRNVFGGSSISSRKAKIPSPEAIQRIYQDGVPHIDRIGRPLFDYVEGVSFFPIWMYGMKHPRTAYLCHADEATKAWVSPEDPRVSNIALLKQGGFNTAQFFGEGDYSEVFLKEVQREGLQALMYWKPLNRGLDAEPTIRNFIRTYGEHPNLLGIIPTEETGHYLSYYKDPLKPSVEKWIEHFAGMRSQIRQFTSRPIFHIDDLWLANQTELPSSDNDLKTWRAWNDPSDVIALDNYPQSLSRLETFDVSRGLSRMGDFVLRTYHERKPFWALINAYEEVPAPGKPTLAEFPSPAQMRAMVYTSIVGGATGIGYFIFDDYASRKSRLIGIRPDTPTAYLHQGTCADAYWSDMVEVSESKAKQSQELWQAVTGINGEIQKLAPVILSRTSRSPYRVLLSDTSISPAPIRTLLKEYRGEKYLIAVNLDRKRLDVTLELMGELMDPLIDPRLSAPSVDVMFENRSIGASVEKNVVASFSDTFEEFAVHVYRWSSRAESAIGQ